jgi:hypothetical protein
LPYRHCSDGAGQIRHVDWLEQPLGIQADAHWADIQGHGSCFDVGAVATAVSVLVAMTRFRASAPSLAVSAQQSIALIYAKDGLAWEVDDATTARQVKQGVLFYNFSLDAHVPAGHLLRSV